MALSVLLSLIVFLGVYAISHDRRHVAVALAVGIPWLFLNWYTTAVASPPLILVLLSNFFEIAFFFVNAGIIVLYLWRAERVTADVIYAAISVYLLFAIAWASAFLIVEKLDAGSFSAGFFDRDGDLTWFDLVFFSFSTITTVGYGDIIPLSSFARSLSIIEMVMGVFFTAILIARLVILYLTNPRNRK